MGKAIIPMLCVMGLTRNQNESINSIVWPRCPERLFCGIHRSAISIFDAVSQFNGSTKERKGIYDYSRN